MKRKITYTFFFILFNNVLFSQDINSLKVNKDFDKHFELIDSVFYEKQINTYKKLLWKTKSFTKAKKDTLNFLKASEKLYKFYVIDNPTKDSAAYYYKYLTKTFKSFKHLELETSFKYRRAISLLNNSNYVDAYKSFNEIKSIIEQNNFKFKPHYYNSFAELHYRLKEYNLSFKKLKIAAKIYNSSDKKNDLLNTSGIYNNLGVLYKNLNQLDSSLVYYNKALDLSFKIKDTTGIAYAYGNIAHVYFLNKKLTNAINYFNKAFKINPKNPSKNLLNNYSNVLIGLGKFKDAENIITSVKNNTEDANIKITSIEQLVKLKKNQKKYLEALKLQDTLALEKEKIINLKKVEEIERLKITYETKKKEQEIELLNKKNNAQKEVIKKNKTLVFITLIVLALAILSFILFLKNKSNKNHVNKLLLQQRLLRSQMNPHFIFNALSNIQTNILKKENSTALKYLVKFSKLLRHNLENTNLNTIVFHEEIIAIQDYLELQKMRLSNPLKYQINIDDSIEQDFIKIPAMLLQPIIENAIEHGLEDTKNGEITITIKDKESYIDCIIEDNGIGYSNTIEKRNPNKTSFATNIINDRLKILSNKTNLKLNYTINDRKENNISAGTIATIQLPILE